jgi:predicted lipid carrier protein YhbT
LGAVATPAEVDRTLKDLVRRLAGASPQTRSTPSGERKLVVIIPDLELVYTGAYSAGAISSLRKARPNGEEDVKITVSSDDLIALADGRLGVGSALLWGKLRVEAGARDLLLLRQLF